ncbi:MAG: hypothetical protein L0387_16845 [Acidobacteria bacterium]|nr:hypothetical protein [Acidobacteriota bacterium]
MLTVCWGSFGISISVAPLDGAHHTASFVTGQAALDHGQAKRMRAARQLADYGIVTAVRARLGVD